MPRQDRLKSQLLSAAVAENVSTINGDLPDALRPRQRWWRLWGPRLAVVALPVGIVLSVIGMTGRTAPTSATGSSMATARRDDGRDDGQATIAGTSPTTAAGTSQGASPRQIDPGLLTRTVNPGVLELGVHRVILDAGHGGDNHGTASAGGLEEKALTLDIATRTRDALVAHGFEVVMTRTGDTSVSLQERAVLANTKRGDIFVSVHLNALQPAAAKGIETYYLGPSDGPERDAIAAAENQQSGYSLSDMRTLLERIYADARRDESRRLADTVQRSLMRAARQVDPALTNRGVKMAPFVVLVATEMPAILAEVSCLSNADEVERLNTPGYRQTLAEALASGIQAFAHAERTGSSGS